MIELLSDVPLCLEWDGGPCNEPATHQVDVLRQGPGAYCAKHAATWNPKANGVKVRRLTPDDEALHFWVQSRDGERLRPRASRARANANRRTR